MATLTGLFTRGSSYYLKVVLPAGHPAKPRYRNGRVVLSLGACGKREAITKGLILRAEILRGDHVPRRKAPAALPIPTTAAPAPTSRVAAASKTKAQKGSFNLLPQRIADRRR